MKQMKIGTINISQQANNHTSGQKPNNLNRQTPNNINRQTPNNVSRQAPNNLNRQTPSQINRQTIKQNNVKRHKKKYKKNLTLHYILLFILVTTTFAILSYTVLFNVKEIEIIGADNLDIEKIKQDINVPIGKSLLKVDTKEIEEKLFKQYYQLATVQADRKFPNKLKISLTPAQPYMCISKGADYFYISENLRVIDRKN
ncbi:MAG: FtsQ-type POTRA domain-containing protein, partial [Oscillospiraceae bacterium]